MLKIQPERLFSIQHEADFQALALAIFQYQANHIPVYKQYLNALKIDPAKVQSIQEIPFLPIEFFKNNTICSDPNHIEITFSSSGTTGSETSKHPVNDVQIYQQSYRKTFEHFYGPLQDYCILALLPSYLERSGSSLIYMCEDLIEQTKQNGSGFYLNEFAQIKKIISENSNNKKILLIGVTYALLDFAEQMPFKMDHTIVMETGGMKGKRKEMLRAEVHEILSNAFGLSKIHSEYGMTELLSQAYSKGDGIFECPAWMRVLIRETNDPFTLAETGRTGGVNIIDLANINSCSFIATQDLGKLHANHQFEILGRFDDAALRGCNLLVD